MAIRVGVWSRRRRRIGGCRVRERKLEQLEARLTLAGDSPYQSLPSAPDLLVQDLSPLVFEPNVGQAAERVDFVARGLDYSFSLTGSGPILTLRNEAGSDIDQFDASLGPLEEGSPPPAETSAILRTQWIHGNSETSAIGLERQPGVTNYLFGEGYTYTDVPNYSNVRYADVYPGIDLVYYGRGGELEYDWMVRPGADPAQIVMGFDGMREMTLDDQGRLVLETSVGTLYQQAPVIYQNINGNRQSVDGGYVLLGSGQVAFQVGDYDTDRELVIDPILVYSTYLGGSPVAAPGHTSGVDAGNDVGTAIASDAEGNTYVTGVTTAIDFPTVNASTSQHPHLSANIRPGPVAFVTKLDPSGVPVFSTYVGQVFSNPNRWMTLHANDIALDGDGKLYIVGNYVDLTTESVEDDFVGVHSQLVEQELGGFAAKLSETGGSLDYLTVFGGDNGLGGSGLLSAATGVVVNESGAAFVVGYTTASNFPAPDYTQTMTIQDKNAAESVGSPDGEPVDTDPFDAFVVRIDQQGAINYSTYLGGRFNDYGKDIALNNDGQVVVVGSTESFDFPGFDSEFQGNVDGFIAVLDLDASTVPFSTSVGSTGDDTINGIAVSRDGNIFVAGVTNSGLLPANSLVRGQPKSEPFQPLHAGPGSISELTPYGADGFVVRLEINGDSATYHYATFLGGSGYDVIWDIDVSTSGNAYVTGETNSADFPLLDTTPEARGRFTDVFVSKLSPTGMSLSYSTVLGGSSTDVAGGIAVDPMGNAHITGWTSNIVCSVSLVPGLSLDPQECPSDFWAQIPSDFPTLNAYQEEFHGGGTPIFGIHPKDAFVAKLSDTSFLAGASHELQAAVPFTGQVATFYTPRLDAEAADFLTLIDWGDGSPLDDTGLARQGSDAGNLWEVVGTHQYPEPGAYPIIVRVLDLNQPGSDADDSVRPLDPAVNINVSRLKGQQFQPTIAVDPTDPRRIFVVASDERGYDNLASGSGGGIFAAHSDTGGRTWTSQLLANGNDGLPPAAGSPVAAFDQLGNLFLAYVGADFNNIVVAISTDGGMTFELLNEQSSGSAGSTDGEPTLDQPTIATGPSSIANGSVWIAFQDRDSGTISVLGAG